MSKIVGVGCQGLLGALFPGITALVAIVNRNTPKGCHFTEMGGLDPDAVASEIEGILFDAAAHGDIPMMFGHSLGGDRVWYFAEKAAAKGIKLPLMISIDPVDWTTDVATQPRGVWEVPVNVSVGINVRQDTYPGGGRLVAKNPAVTRISEKTWDQYPHASMWGQDICNNPNTQALVLSAIQAAARTSLK